MSTVDGPKRDTVRIEGPAPRILLIQAPYYEEIVGGMRKGVERVSFLPVLIDPQLRPEVLRSGDARFEDALAYMRWASDGFASTMQAEGDEILVR